MKYFNDDELDEEEDRYFDDADDDEDISFEDDYDAPNVGDFDDDDDYRLRGRRRSAQRHLLQRQ
jgi:hypothetical protein